ncbi:MAG TPA: hypothetical protein VK430_02045 [Xanthobacteraceae bacterium]|nr:hypothetical protein [Xanthobacteraceae bacterium]
MSEASRRGLRFLLLGHHSPLTGMRGDFLPMLYVRQSAVRHVSITMVGHAVAQREIIWFPDWIVTIDTNTNAAARRGASAGRWPDSGRSRRDCSIH